MVSLPAAALRRHPVAEKSEIIFVAKGTTGAEAAVSASLTSNSIGAMDAHGGQNTNQTIGIIATPSLRAILEGIHDNVRRWKAARNQGEAVLTNLSNTLLLRTYVDKGRNSNAGSLEGGGGQGDGGGAAVGVWGALAGAGNAIAKISLVTEARARRLHSDLCALQDEMLAAAAGIRRYAGDARRRVVATAERTGSPGNFVLDAAGGAGGTRVEGEEDENMEQEDGDGDCTVGGGYGLGDVADTAAEVAEMFLREGLVTATVVQGVGTAECSRDREALTMYAAAWMMQPYVDARRVKELQTMVFVESRGAVSAGRGSGRGKGGRTLEF